MFGVCVREARLNAALSREGLRRRMKRYAETVPSLSAIRDLENGKSGKPQERFEKLYKTALPDLVIVLNRNKQE